MRIPFVVDSDKLRKNNSYCSTIRITIASFAVVMLLFFIVSCSKSKVEITSSVENRMLTPKLKADIITTLISDSGITRYRISAQQWLVFDRDTQPYWDFPKGIYFERFNEEYVVDAYLESNKAKYFEHPQLWKLDGDVVARNLNDEMFETQQMFWDQKHEKIYSDSLIKITQKDKIIIGLGFESNQSFSRYFIKKPQGIFPIDKDSI